MRLLSLLARDVLRAMFVSARVFRATTSSSKSTVSEGRAFALSATSSCSSAARAAASEDTVVGVRIDSTSESSGDLDSSPHVWGARSSGPRDPDVRKEWTSCVSLWFFEASSSTDWRSVASDVEARPPVTGR